MRFKNAFTKIILPRIIDCSAVRRGDLNVQQGSNSGTMTMESKLVVYCTPNHRDYEWLSGPILHNLPFIHYTMKENDTEGWPKL